MTRHRSTPLGSILLSVVMPLAVSAQAPGSPEVFPPQAMAVTIAGDDALVTVLGPGVGYDRAVDGFVDGYPDAVGHTALRQALLGAAQQNQALVIQRGAANVALLEQEGYLNTAAVTQDGTGNVLLARQVGAENIIGVWLRGDRNSVSLLQLGDDNQYFLDFRGNDLAHSFEQVGTGHRVIQIGEGTSPISVRQSGPGMEIRIEHNTPR